MMTFSLQPTVGTWHLALGLAGDQFASLWERVGRLARTVW